MALAKRFKLKFPNVNIPSFQLCRLKSPSSLPRNPKPLSYRLSPVNPKALDIGYPSLPAPPPSTPDYSFVISSTTKIKSDGCESLCRSRSCGQHCLSDSSTEFPRCSVKTSTFEATEKLYVKQRVYKETKKAKEETTVFSNEEDDDENSLVLLDSSRSFSNDRQRYPIGQSAAPNDAVRERPRRRERNAAAEKARDGRRVAETAAEGKRKVRESFAVVKKSEKVRESFAVVKKSEDPYEDFKRSMLEMIMGKQMFEAGDLEELLQCFLTLNSRQYHGIIVEAFSEIWEILFSDSHVKHRLSF